VFGAICYPTNDSENLGKLQPKADIGIFSVYEPTPEVVAPIILKQHSKLNLPSFQTHDVEEDNHDIEVAHMGNDPYFGISIPEVSSDQSSSSDVIHTIVPPDHQVSKHNSIWTKDHLLENIIGHLDRPVST
ncbi:hypothetical protein Tco_0635757, partial [Tanacetum coccineum]